MNSRIFLTSLFIFTQTAFAVDVSSTHPLIIVNATDTSASFIYHGSNGGYTTTLGSKEACYFPIKGWGFNNNERFYIENPTGSYNALYLPVADLSFSSNLGDGDGMSKTGWDDFFLGNSSAWNDCSSKDPSGKWTIALKPIDPRHQYNFCATGVYGRPIVIAVSSQNTLPAGMPSPDTYISNYGFQNLPQCAN